MDLSKEFLRNRKASMGSFIPQYYSDDFVVPQLVNRGASLHSFSKDLFNMPYKSFSYPNNLCNFKLSPQKILKKAMHFSTGFKNLENLPAVSLTCVVGGFIEGGRTVCYSEKGTSRLDNPLESMLNHIVSQSMDITRTMSCPEPFTLCDRSPLPCACDQGSNKTVADPSDSANLSDKVNYRTKMSYADVAKMNLSNPSKPSIPCASNPLTDLVVSSQRPRRIDSKKQYKVISPPQKYKVVNKNTSYNNYPRNNHFGTNNFDRRDKDFSKSKVCVRNLNSKRLNNKRVHSSLKRELGTKRNNQKMDIDGSMWGRDNTGVEVMEEHIPCIPEQVPTQRKLSISSDSDCSSEVSEQLKNHRVRSLSECSINSIDSEDSYIVFEQDSVDSDCVNKYCDDLYISSSDDDDDDEDIEGNSCCNGYPQPYYLQCANSKWDTLPSKETDCDEELQLSDIVSSQCLDTPHKKVRFAKGDDFAKVRKLCVWDYAHRAARIGPWEQAARDRDRFSKRTLSLIPILTPILDPSHRSAVYNERFAPS